MFVYQSIESLLFEISNKALLRKESEGTLEGYFYALLFLICVISFTDACLEKIPSYKSNAICVVQ